MANATVDVSLDRYNNEWQEDSAVNELDIVAMIRDVPKLHAKWLRYLSESKQNRITAQRKYDNLRRLKYRYYRGEMTQLELEKYGWEQWRGNKPIRSEMEEFFRGDKDLNQYLSVMETMDGIISMLEMVLRSIHMRGYDLKTLLEAKKFYNGMN